VCKHLGGIRRQWHLVSRCEMFQQLKSAGWTRSPDRDDKPSTAPAHELAVESVQPAGQSRGGQQHPSATTKKIINNCQQLQLALAPTSQGLEVFAHQRVELSETILERGNSLVLGGFGQLGSKFAGQDQFSLSVTIL